MKILVKFPTRQRPQKFLKTLSNTIKLQSTSNVEYLISCDTDDLSMDEKLIEVVHNKWNFVTFKKGLSSGKIHACNRDVNQYGGEWDIIVLMSDDMICQKKGWDEKLINEMKEHFPDKDGVLFHNDGFTQRRLNTMCILGRKYYDRFGYIYNPNYVSLWCDNEFMEVANNLKKQVYFDEVLFKHEHPANTGDKISEDLLYNKNDKFYLRDKQTYEQRKRNNFN